MTWKLINTGLFAIAFGYLLWKSAPRFFNARSADIQRAIKDATGLKMNADLRYSEADRKMATLPDEVKRLRAQAAAEMEREHARIQHDTEQEIQHIRRNIQFESDALRSESRDQIRRHSLRSLPGHLTESGEGTGAGPHPDRAVLAVQEGAQPFGRREARLRRDFPQRRRNECPLPERSS